MLKNVLFSLKKIVKIAKRWGGLRADVWRFLQFFSLCLRAPRPPRQSYHIVKFSLICPQRTDSFGINQKTLFSCKL